MSTTAPAAAHRAPLAPDRPSAPADLERRLHAYALDRVPGWGLPLLLAWGLEATGRPLWLVLLGPLALALALVATQAALLGLRGATPGMALTGLRLEAAGTGGPIGLPAALRRQAVLALAGPPTFGLGLATLAWTAATDPTGRRRGWHDEVAGSVVVDVRPLPDVEVVAQAPQPIVNLTAMRLVPAERPERPDRPETPAPGVRADTTPTPDAPPVPAPTVVPGRRRAEPALAAPATRAAPTPPVPPRRRAAWRVEVDTGESVPVEGLVLLGRGPQPGPGEEGARLVPLASQDMSVSKTHAQIQPSEDGSLVVTDRGSTNGSVLIRQGVPRHLSPGRPVTLVDGDVLRLGDRVLEVSHALRHAQDPRPFGQ